MSGKNINFEDKKNQEKWLQTQKDDIIKIDDIDVNKILVSKEEPYGTKNSFKYFIGFNDNDVIIPQMIGYVRKFDGNTTMPFKISVKLLLRKYNQIWKKVEKLLKIELDSNPVYGDDDKYIKTKVKIYDGGMIANFQSKKCLKKKHHISFYQ